MQIVIQLKIFSHCRKNLKFGVGWAEYLHAIIYEKSLHLNQTNLTIDQHG